MKEVEQNTENKILAAAEKEFITKGYAGARTTAIAEEAGVTHAMLHYYFRTKQNLFEKIISKNFGLLSEIMLTSVDNPDIPLFEKLKQVIEKHLDSIAEHPDLPRFMLNEVFSQPEHLALVTQMLNSKANIVIASLQRQLDEYTEQGLCRKVDAAMLVLDIISLNIFAFVARPIVNTVLGGIMDDMGEFVATRKKENIVTIMRKIMV